MECLSNSKISWNVYNILTTMSSQDEGNVNLSLKCSYVLITALRLAHISFFKLVRYIRPGCVMWWLFMQMVMICNIDFVSMLQRMFCSTSADLCESFASLVSDNGLMFPRGDIVVTPSDNIVMFAASTDVMDVPQIVVLSHYNLVACWTQLGYA